MPKDRISPRLEGEIANRLWMVSVFGRRVMVLLVYWMGFVEWVWGVCGQGYGILTGCRRMGVSDPRVAAPVGI